MFPPTVLTRSTALGLAALLVGACTPVDEEGYYGTRAMPINWDGGTKLIENGKTVPCLMGDKYGCCLNSTLVFCKNNILHEGSCGSSGCGWSSKWSHYACGGSGAGPDPKFPLACPGNPEGGIPPEAGPPDDGGGTPPDIKDPAACGLLPVWGCCDGFMLRRCDNKAVMAQDCSKETVNKKCGWNSTKGRYECGTSSAAGPTGKPMSCKGYMPDGGAQDGPPPPVGDGGGPGLQKCGKLPVQGCCGGQMLDFCSAPTNGFRMSLDCTTNKYCGWNSSKGKYTCGITTKDQKDPSGKYPISCKSYLEAPKNDAGGTNYPDGMVFNESGPPPGCGKLTAKGCCVGNTLDWCAGTQKMTKTCSTGQKCGWNGTKYACGTSDKSDPSNTYPKHCKHYMPGASDGGTQPPPGDGSPPPPPGDGGGGPPKMKCNGIPTTGCCQGVMNEYCSSSGSSGTKMNMDCSKKPSCGWNSAQNKYTCGTSGGSSPNSSLPKLCSKYMKPPPGQDASTNPTDGPKPPPADGPKPPPKDGPGPPPADGPKPPPGDGPKPPPGDGPKPPPGDGPKPPPGDGPKPPPGDGPKPPPGDGPKPPPGDGPKTKDEAGKQPDGSGTTKKQGSEGGPCYPNDTCDKGLQCLSKLCVKAPDKGVSGADSGGTSRLNDDTGCECNTASASPPVWTLLLLGLALLGVRRRRND